MARKRRGTSAKKARRRARKRKGAVQVRRKKEFAYRGYSLEELQALSWDEQIELYPARVRRTLNRGLSEDQRKLREKLTRWEDGEQPVRTHLRNMPVLPNFVGKEVAIYNGRTYKEIKILPEMIGHYLGEFALTRGVVMHSGPGVGATRSSKFMPLK